MYLQAFSISAKLVEESCLRWSIQHFSLKAWEKKKQTSASFSFTHDCMEAF